MKKRIYCFLTLFSFLLMAPLLAQAVQCPNSSNFVNMGATIEQVIQQCGQPTQRKDIKTEAAVWTYSLMSFASAHIGFTVVFEGNSVSKLITSQQLTKTMVSCPNGPIRIGDTPRQVVAACGQPSSIRNVSTDLEKERGKITHLIYQPESYLPKTTFIFKNGNLVDTR